MSQLLQRFFQRQRHLLRVPAAGQPGIHRLTPREFYPEAREAQRPRPLRCGIVFHVMEAVAGLLLTTARAQYCPAGRSGNSRALKRRRPPVVQRELLIHSYIPLIGQLYGEGVTD